MATSSARGRRGMRGGGLRIVWDPAIDHGAWPGPLATRDAIAGEAWLGPMGLLARLETELGLGAQHATSLERVGALAAQLAPRTGWWRASYDADASGTAQRLLRDRDLLAIWGWRGEPASARLTELWTATADALPGFPDRLHAITDALSSRTIDIETIEVRSPIASLVPAWRSVFARLAASGVRIVEISPPIAPARGDLRNARSLGFVPTADHSLTLLRPQGALAAADEIAASLAALPSRDGVLIIGPDDVLDAALARHGVPRLGAAARPTGSSALLRLVIEAAFEPMEPADLHALLSLSPGPIPRRIASGLIRALGDFPSRRAPAWTEALAKGLARCDEDWRAAAAERTSTLLMPTARRDGAITVADIVNRLGVLATWARSGIEKSPSLLSIAALAQETRKSIMRSGLPTISLVQLRRLCDEIGNGHAADSPGEAGFASVAEPGAVLAPAKTIVWWSFTRDSAPHAPRLRLSRAERTELTRLGVTPPDLGLVMEAAATRWRRPLDQATDALVLVCPQTTDAGERCFPHPLWDELCAAMPTPDQAQVLQATRLTLPSIAARRTIAPRALPTPTARISTGASLVLREHESPSSLEKLLGCSLRWALDYRGRLRTGMSDGPGAPTPLLYGTLAHHLLAAVFAEGALDADAARARAQELVDDELATLCESLELPRYQVERTDVRQAILRSAKDLGALITKLGATVRGVELKHAAEIDGVSLSGTADLALSSPDVVLDLKWGKTTNRNKLVAGAALQLAAYAELLAVPGSVPDSGYFTLQRQQILAATGSALPGAELCGTATPRETWRGALTVLAERKTELASGVLHAPAADGAEIESALVGGRLTIAPDCQYCSFGGLCGQSGCT